MPTPVKQEWFDWKRTLRGAAALGSVAIFGGALCAASWVAQPRQFAFSWLHALVYFFTVCTGALVWVLIHHAVDAEWSVVVRRQMENVAALLPAFILLAVPLVPLAPHLYAWLRPDVVAADTLLAHKAPLLNGVVLGIASALALLFCAGVAVALRRFSVRQDATGAPIWTLRCRQVTYPAIPAFAIFYTLSAVLWLMSLDPHWFSAMWTVYVFAGSTVAGLAAVVLLVAALIGMGHLRGVVNEEHLHVMGKLLFAFSIFWAYIAYGQYFLIWYANLPEETLHFLRRNTESWHAVSCLLAAGHFLVPFMFLLPRRMKRRPKALAFVAGWILAMHLVDIYLVILPELHPLGFEPHWLDLVCLATMGAMLGLLLLRLVARAALYPSRDPRLADSLRITN